MWPCTGSVSGWVERGHARGCPNFDGQEPLRGIQRSTPPRVELAVHVRHHSQRQSRTAAAARMTRNVAGADHGTADALAGRGRPSTLHVHGPVHPPSGDSVRRPRRQGLRALLRVPRATPRCRVGGRAGRRLPGRPTFRSWPPSSEFSGGRSAHTCTADAYPWSGVAAPFRGRSHSRSATAAGHSRGADGECCHEQVDTPAFSATAVTVAWSRAISAPPGQHCAQPPSYGPSHRTGQNHLLGGSLLGHRLPPIVPLRRRVLPLPISRCRITGAAFRLPVPDCRFPTAASRARPPSGCVQHRHL